MGMLGGLAFQWEVQNKKETTGTLALKKIIARIGKEVKKFQYHHA
jgi:hypothetical protein